MRNVGKFPVCGMIFIQADKASQDMVAGRAEQRAGENKKMTETERISLKRVIASCRDTE
jgi:hypothetical protein